MTTILQLEIHEQPAVLSRLLEAESANIVRIAVAIRNHSPRFIMIAARGTSDNAARYGQYLFGAHNHLPVALATPSLFTLYQSPPCLEGALVLAISQSGQSPDILAVVEEGNKQGALTLALTNDIASPLAHLAVHTIDLNAGPEKSIAATKTYTASLMALAMLSVALSDVNGQRHALDLVPAFVADALSASGAIISAAQAFRESEACVVLGRGYNYSTAFEIALKLKELTYILAEPYSSADFQHGPVALVEKDFPIIAVVPQGKTSDELTGFLKELQVQRPRLVAITPLRSLLDVAHTPISISVDIPEWLSPLVAVVPGQLFALGLALAKGINPDRPRRLQKVTRTT